MPASTAFVAAALGIFIVGFSTLDVGDGKGLTFNYRFADLAVAVIAVFFGRMGLSLAATGCAGRRSRSARCWA